MKTFSLRHRLGRANGGLLHIHAPVLLSNRDGHSMRLCRQVDLSDDRVHFSTAGLPAVVYCRSQKIETGQSPTLHALNCCGLLACHFFRTKAGTPGST